MKKTSRALLLGVLIASVTVSVVFAWPRLAVYKNAILYQAGDTVGSFALNNEGDELLEWSLTCDQTWFWAEPSSGTVGAAGAVGVFVYVDRTGLADATYEGELFITSNGGDHDIRIIMIVRNAPKLHLNDNLLTLSTEQTSTRFTMTNDGLNPLEWSVSADQPWIVPGPPSSGTLDYGQYEWVTVHLDATGLPSLNEEHFGEVTVTSNGGNAFVPVRYAPNVSPGILGVYTDGSGSDCNFIYSAPGLLQVVVVQTHTDGATAVQFSAPKPDCWKSATFLSDVDIFPVTIGSTQTGKAVGYGVCVSAPIWVTAINYFVQTPAGEPCCMYPVLPDPSVPSGQIEVVDCNNSLVFGRGTYGVVNPDETCWCNSVVRVEKTTWGRVKALYAPEDESD